MLKHPKHLGFSYGLKIHIGTPSRILEETHEASELVDVVYVALGEGPKPVYYKVGQTKWTLLRRWNSTLRIFNRENENRVTEQLSRAAWLKKLRGKNIEVWVKPASKISIPYAKGLSSSKFSARCAEEEFLDEYYAPVFGMSLGSRGTSK